MYGFLGVLDPFAGYILYWIPFFSPLKLAFLVWCWAPTTKGKSNTLFTFYTAVLSLMLTNVVLRKDELEYSYAVTYCVLCSFLIVTFAVAVAVVWPFVHSTYQHNHASRD